MYILERQDWLRFHWHTEKLRNCSPPCVTGKAG